MGDALRSAVLVAAVSGMAATSASAQSSAHVWPDLEPGPYAVGYTVRHEYDHSRTFHNKLDYFGNPTSGEIARPIQITIWYPAAADPGAQPMRVSDYYHAIAAETDFTPPAPDELRGLVEDREQILMMEWRVSPSSSTPPPDRQDAGSRTWSRERVPRRRQGTCTMAASTSRGRRASVSEWAHTSPSTPGCRSPPQLHADRTHLYHRKGCADVPVSVFIGARIGG